MNYRCIQLPRPCPRAVYESAAQKIGANAAKQENVIAVYQMGNVGAPGISDLDIVVVVKGVAQFSYDEVLAGLNDHERYTLMHGLFCVNELFWRHKPLFFKFDNLKILAGQSIDTVALPSIWLDWASLRIAIQHLIRVYASLFVQLFLHLLKVRSLLCELNALRYDLEVLSEMLSAEVRSDFLNYIQIVQQLRTEWFDAESDSISRFIDLCLRGRALIAKVIEELNCLSAIQFNAPFFGDSLPINSVIINSNRMIVATSDSVGETVSWPVRVLKSTIGKCIGGNIVTKFSHRIGHFKVGIPSHIFRYVINSTWRNLDGERRRFIEKRSEVIASNIGKSGNALLKQSLPLLDFLEK